MADLADPERAALTLDAQRRQQEYLTRIAPLSRLYGDLVHRIPFALVQTPEGLTVTRHPEPWQQELLDKIDEMRRMIATMCGLPFSQGTDDAAAG